MGVVIKTDADVEVDEQLSGRHLTTEQLAFRKRIEGERSAINEAYADYMFETGRSTSVMAGMPFRPSWRLRKVNGRWKWVKLR